MKQLEEFDDDRPSSVIAAKKVTVERDMSSIICFSCNRPGHYSRNCREKRKVEGNFSGQKLKRTKVNTVRILLNKIHCDASKSENGSIEFIIDSGASHNILGNDGTSLNPRTRMNHGKVVAVGGTRLVCDEIMDISLTTTNDFVLRFNKFLFVPKSDVNLLSVNSLIEIGLTPMFNINTVNFINEQSKIIFTANKGFDNLYRVNLKVNVAGPHEKHPHMSKEVYFTSLVRSLNVCYNRDWEAAQHTTRINKLIEAKPLDSELQNWHETFGHCGSAKMKIILPTVMSKTVEIPDTFHCDACVKGKLTRKIKGTVTPLETHTYEIGELLHMDIVGPVKPETLGKSRFVLNVLEETTRYTMSFVLPTKEGPTVLTKIQHCVEWFNTQCNLKVKRFRTDQGSEFTFKGLTEYCEKQGIMQEFTNTYSPSQNGNIERLNRSLMDITRTWILGSRLPACLWGELYLYGTYIYNHRPHKTLGNKTPAGCLFKEGSSFKHPLTKFMHPIGCKVSMNIAPEVRPGKLGSRVVNGWFIGIVENQPGVKAWVEDTNQIYASRHVQVWNNIRFDGNSSEATELCVPGDGESPEDSQEEYVIEDIIDEIYNDAGEKRYRVRWEGYGETEDTYEPFENIGHTDVFRRWEGMEDESQVLTITTNKEDFPTLQQAMKRADKDQWLLSMQEEMDALHEQNTWEVVPRPSDRKVISVKWVLRIKWNTERTVPKYKARLCVRGFTQVQHVDYEETFSPTLSKAGLRLILALGVQMGLKIHTVDCKNAFLHGDIDKDIYIEQPPLFLREGTTHMSHVCKLVKALYGLKQAPLIWCQTLRAALLKGGFEQMATEPCIFVRRDSTNSNNKRSYDLKDTWSEVLEQKDLCILGVYVDDITILARDEESLRMAKDLIGTAFNMKDEGEIKKIVGIEVQKTKDGIILHQRSMIEQMLAHQNMDKCNMNRIPMETNGVTLLTGSEGKPLEDNHWYRSVVGELLYQVVCTRPDISFAVNLCARKVENPTEDHKRAIQKILRYLKGTADKGLVYERKDKEPRLVAFSDSDFASDKVDSKSTCGYIVMMNGCTISWQTSKQKSVSTSTVEAEYVAASKAVKEVIWLNYLLEEVLGYDKMPKPLLLLDSAGAETLIQNEGVSQKTKHIRYSYHFIRDCHAAKLVDIRHVGGTDNPADMLTKPLAHDKFSKHCEKINLGSVCKVNLAKEFTKGGYLRRE